MISAILLIIIYFSFISLGLQDSLLGSAWPSMHASLNVPLHYAGFISMIVAIGTVTSTTFSVFIIRRFGTGNVLTACVLMTAAALMGFSFSNSFFYLCLLAVPLGFGGGSIDAALNNHVALHYKARHMSWLHCFWGVGASIGPVIMSAFLIHRNSWASGYRAISIIQLILVVLLFTSLPLWKRNETGTGDKEPVSDSVHPSPENSVQKNDPINFRKLFSIAGVKEVLLVFFFYCAIEVITIIWGVSYLVAEKGISPEIAAQWISLFFVGITAGRFLSGFITIKLNNRQMVRMGQILIGCGIIVFILPFGNSTLLPGLFMIGLGCAPIFPSLIHETPKNFGKEYSQAIVGIQMGSAYLGNALMPPVFGGLTSYLSFGIFPVFLGIALATNIIFFEILNKKVDKAGKQTI